ISDAAVRVAKELTGLNVDVGEEVLTIKHSVTRYAITLVCLDAALSSGEFVSGAYAAAKWLTPAELAEYPASSPQRKLMTALAKGNGEGQLFGSRAFSAGHFFASIFSMAILAASAVSKSAFSTSVRSLGSASFASGPIVTSNSIRSIRTLRCEALS